MSKDPQEKWWAEDAERHNDLGRIAVEKDFQVDTGPGEVSAEDAIAHLKQLPPDRAVAQAREWTGRNDIKTLEEAIAAVRESLAE